MTLTRSAGALALLLLALPAAPAAGDRNRQADELAAYVRENYTRSDHRIPMRDGVRLYTIVYAPRDTSRTYPLLLLRTPYSIGPYEKGAFRKSLGPNRHFAREGYIFVYQDVRGRYLSEGTFVNMRPHRDRHPTPRDIDESTDTYDTIAWLLKHIPNHNGKAGLYGISYPGFYAAAGMIDAHPALKAVSPQAPIADWFFDDFHHHGAFFLPHAFSFFASFGQPRPRPTTEHAPRFQYGTPDGYQFFLDLGPLRNADRRHFHHRIAFWDEMAEHPNYDAFWRARNLLPHLHKVAPAVMTVGGWFDAEDLYGALKTYAAVEDKNPGIFNVLVMGPWRHGGWAGGKGNRLGNVSFGADTSPFFQETMELPFFNHFLKGKGRHGLAEANVFETGGNRWRRFDHWPPRGLATRALYFHAGGRLAPEAPAGDGDDHDKYVSDPEHPVPYTERIINGMDPAYMTDDQRFAARRPDVVTYQTGELKDGLTLAGPLVADLWVSTSGTDSDWVVKVIDVFPPDAKDSKGMAPGQHLGGYQMMVRSEVIRGRFRKEYSRPEPFVPGRPTRVKLVLQDVLHHFGPGHRLMVQVCSTWFPLVDRNPHHYVDNVFRAEEKDFIRATQRVYRSRQHPSCLRVGVLPAGPPANGAAPARP
jgi:putative CocE/NonD family hydrolase